MLEEAGLQNRAPEPDSGAGSLRVRFNTFSVFCESEQPIGSSGGAGGVAKEHVNKVGAIFKQPHLA